MLTYKAIILNKEISINYKDGQKDKLLEVVNEINFKLKSYDKYNGKISDSKILSFLAVKLQAELFEIKENQTKDNKFKKQFQESSNENITLNDKLFEERKINEDLRKENDLLNQELKKIQDQIDLIINLIKKNYDD